MSKKTIRCRYKIPEPTIDELKEYQKSHSTRGGGRNRTSEIGLKQE